MGFLHFRFVKVERKKSELRKRTQNNRVPITVDFCDLNLDSTAAGPKTDEETSHHAGESHKFTVYSQPKFRGVQVSYVKSLEGSYPFSSSMFTPVTALRFKRCSRRFWEGIKDNVDQANQVSADSCGDKREKGMTSPLTSSLRSLPESHHHSSVLKGADTSCGETPKRLGDKTRLSFVGGVADENPASAGKGTRRDVTKVHTVFSPYKCPDAWKGVVIINTYMHARDAYAH